MTKDELLETPIGTPMWLAWPKTNLIPSEGGFLQSMETGLFEDPIPVLFMGLDLDYGSHTALFRTPDSNDVQKCNFNYLSLRPLDKGDTVTV